MIVSDAAIPYIKLQRTDYCQQANIKQLFSEDMKREFQRILPFLPVAARSILDIGCGVAGIDVLLYKHYGSVDICLLDKTEMAESLTYGLKETPEFYNSLQVAKEMLELNGVDTKNIFTQEAVNHLICFDGREFNLVISLLSWGFHYPIEGYLTQVTQRLNGSLILDVRKGSNGLALIKDCFGDYTIIYEAERFVRLVARREA